MRFILSRSRCICGLWMMMMMKRTTMMLMMRMMMSTDGLLWTRKFHVFSCTIKALIFDVRKLDKICRYLQLLINGLHRLLIAPLASRSPRLFSSPPLPYHFSLGQLWLALGSWPGLDTSSAAAASFWLCFAKCSWIAWRHLIKAQETTTTTKI